MFTKNNHLFVILLFCLFCSYLPSVFGQAKTNQMYEISLTSDRKYVNPIKDVLLNCSFYAPDGRVFTVAGFWDGGSNFKIRFAPPSTGIWTYKTFCSDSTNTGLKNQKDTFSVTAYDGDDPCFAKGFPKVSADGHYLTYGNGDPFFYLGDTAWEMTWKSNKEEVQKYISDRKKKRFSVLQIVTMSHMVLQKFGVMNRYGETYFLNQDYSFLNPRYFDYLDYIVQTANDSGMTVALVPLWAGMMELHFDPRFQRFSLTKEQSFLVARYIGARYAGSNIMWIVAGDNVYDTQEKRDFWSDFADTLRNASGNRFLTTTHPAGYRASFQYYDQYTKWLDFNMYQSSHVAGGDFTWEAGSEGYKKLPPKPVLNGESCYEDIYNNLWAPGDTNHVNTFRIRPQDVRQATFESILSGALIGMTYGANGIFQWSTPDIPSGFDPRVSVDTAWTFPASAQMTNIRNMMEKYHWYSFVPRIDLLISSFSSDYIPVALNSDVLMAFMPMNTTSANINLIVLDSNTVQYFWVNPATGDSTKISTITNANLLANYSFTPPDTNDWVLIARKILKINTITTQPNPPNQEISVGIFPNPVTKQFVVQYSVPQNSVYTPVLRIFNVLGENLWERNILKEFQEITLDADNIGNIRLVHDVYFVQIQCGDAIKTTMFTIQPY